MSAVGGSLCLVSQVEDDSVCLGVWTNVVAAASNKIVCLITALIHWVNTTSCEGCIAQPIALAGGFATIRIGAGHDASASTKMRRVKVARNLSETVRPRRAIWSRLYPLERLPIMAEVRHLRIHRQVVVNLCLVPVMDLYTIP